MNKVLCSLLFLGTMISSQAYSQDTPDSTVLIVMPYDNGKYSMEMTGFVAAGTHDENNNPYIITARHGIMGDHDQGFPDIQEIAVYDWNSHYLGTANVAHCDGQWGNNETNVNHDYCVLSINRPTESWQMIPGYRIADKMPAGVMSLCGDFDVSWTSGASGSPLIVNGSVVGILSMTYNEKRIPYEDWSASYVKQGKPVPHHVVNYMSNPENYVVIGSCGYFSPLSPETLAFINADSKYTSDAIPHVTAYDTYGFPNMYRMHMNGVISNDSVMDSPTPRQPSSVLRPETSTVTYRP